MQQSQLFFSWATHQDWGNNLLAQRGLLWQLFSDPHSVLALNNPGNLCFYSMSPDFRKCKQFWNSVINIAFFSTGSFHIDSIPLFIFYPHIYLGKIDLRKERLVVLWGISCHRELLKFKSWFPHHSQYESIRKSPNPWIGMNLIMFASKATLRT